MVKLINIEEWELRYKHDVEGLSQPELAMYYDVSQGTIGNRLKEYGIEPHERINRGKIDNT